MAVFWMYFEARVIGASCRLEVGCEGRRGVRGDFKVDELSRRQSWGRCGEIIYERGLCPESVLDMLNWTCR